MLNFLLSVWGIIIFTLLLIAVFFFAVTRGALLLRAVTNRASQATSHVYPVYSQMPLIKLVDMQPLMSAILLFQYSKLVSFLTRDLESLSLNRQHVLMTSCPFGNIIPLVTETALSHGADKIILVDIIANELVHARSKFSRECKAIECRHEDASQLTLLDASVHANILFFLLHELPPSMQVNVLKEAVRVLKPGGTLYIGEFHRPTNVVMRMLSWCYLKTFEPLGLLVWDEYDPIKQLNQLGTFTYQKETVCFGNYQLLIARKEG